MRELITGRFDWLEHELAQRPYLAGDRFTVADITALCAIDFGKVSAIRIDPATHPALAAWHQRVSERPSAKA
jgi:glutathione S-transferase